MTIDKQINEEQIFLCADFIEKCDVKYPHFPCWQLCGESYIYMDMSITCKNYEMIKRILGKCTF